MEKDSEIESFATIRVMGIGGSGGNAVNRMIAQKLKGVEFIVVNTDAQALVHNQAAIKIQVGKETKRGFQKGILHYVAIKDWVECATNPC